MKIGDIIREGVKAGKTTEAILADVHAAFPGAKTKAASVAWYRSQMRKGGDAPRPQRPTKAPPQPKTPLAKAIAAAESAKGYDVRAIKKTTGMEGPGFICLLTRGGKPVAEVADYGDGGEAHWKWLDKEPAEVIGVNYTGKEFKRMGTREEAMFYLHCRHLPKENSPWDKPGDEPRHVAPDVYVERLVNDVLLRNQLRSMLKTKIVMVEGGKLYTLKCPSITAEALAKAREKNPNAVILNDMAEEERLALVRSLQD